MTMPLPIHTLHPDHTGITALDIAGARLIIIYRYHPEKGVIPPHYEIKSIKLPASEQELLALLEDLDALPIIEAKLSLKELK